MPESETIRSTPSSSRSSGRRRAFVYGLLVILFIFHHDYVLWGIYLNVYGIPISLAYDMLYSLACVFAWSLVVRWAWPDRLEAFAEEADAAAGAEQEGRV